MTIFLQRIGTDKGQLNIYNISSWKSTYPFLLRSLSIGWTLLVSPCTDGKQNLAYGLIFNTWYRLIKESLRIDLSNRERKGEERSKDRKTKREDKCLVVDVYWSKKKHQPEHLGISHTAIDDDVHSGEHSAWLFSWLTFIASIHAPIVTSSLLNIRKLSL